MISKDILKRAGKKKGLENKEHIEKDYFQDLLLYYLFKKTNKLIFKGGTCLYKIYSLQRFSEDLDFSTLVNVDIKNILKGLSKRFDNMNIDNIKEMKTAILIKVRFEGILTRANTVRLDINTKNPVICKYDVKTYTPSYVDLNPFSLRAMKTKEILAEKIHSLLSRRKARDLYDLFFLLRFVEPDKEIIEKKLMHFGIKMEYENIEKSTKELENLWKPELKHFVLDELPDFIPVKDFVLRELSVLK